MRLVQFQYEHSEENENDEVGREETPGRQCLRYADTSLSDLLGRPSLYYADQSSDMQQTSLHHTAQIFLNLGFYVLWKILTFFDVVA